MLCPLLVGLLCGCQPTVQPSSAFTPRPISASEAQEQATQAFARLGGTLKAELGTALADGGPGAAVEVCRERAPRLAEQISQEVGFPVGRSSHRWRQPNNAPQPELADYLAAHSAQPGAQAPVAVVEAPEQYTVIAPIVTQPLCLTCHGDAKTFPPALREALAKNYPDDRATGFAAGDLRGVFWAKVPSRSLEGVIPASAPGADPASRRIETH